MKVIRRSRVLLVEDDHLQARWITETLERAFQVKVEPIRTEAEFYAKIDAIEKDPPDLVIMDVMLRWTDPEPQVSAPPQRVIDEGYIRAGIRCVELLVEREGTRSIPVILFTVLSADDLESPPDVDNVAYLSKEADPDELISRVRSIINRDQLTA